MMSAYRVIPNNFIIYCYLFTVMFAMIKSRWMLQKRARWLRLTVQTGILILAQLIHILLIAHLGDGMEIMGRFLLIGLTTYIFDMRFGGVAAIGSVVFSLLFGALEPVVFIAGTLIYYFVFGLYGSIVREYAMRVRRISVVIALLGAGSLLYLFSMIDKDIVTDSIGSYWTVVVVYLFQLVLFNAVDYTKTKDMESLETNIELEKEVARRTGELKALNQGLEAEIAERNRVEEVLKTAQKEAVHANKIKSEFLANMSHEIRTPINAIMGFNYLLGNTSLTRQQKNYLKKANDSSEHLLNVINDILDFSKIEADQMTLQLSKVSLYKIINNVFDNVMYELYRKKLSMTFDIDPGLPEFGLIDGKKLQQILLNLVSNAVKFTDAGNISLKVRYIEDNQSVAWLKMTVGDTGIGISKENQRKLFNAFSQVEGDINRRFGGTGLGLSISKSLVELMGGTIHVNSRIGEGSEFHFSVRMNNIQYRPNLNLMKTRKIALIHDGKGESSLIKKQLEQIGCRIICFEMGDVSDGGIRVEKFDQIYIECDSLLLFRSESFENMLKDLGCPEKMFVINYFRYEGVHSLEHKKLVRSILFYPMGIEGIFHNLVGRSEKIQAGANTTYETRYRNTRLLLVEDNDINQQVSKEILTDKGIEVIVADNGVEAIEMVKRIEFDAILMDIHMPEMDGFEATRIIRSFERCRELPIIAMTADTRVDKESSFMESGLTDSILKPIDVKKMFIVLDQYLQNQYDPL